MERGNHLTIVCISAIVVVAVVAAAILALHDKDAAIAGFVTIAMGALGVLAPSALQQHKDTAPAQQTDAKTDDGDINISTAAGKGDAGASPA